MNRIHYWRIAGFLILVGVLAEMMYFRFRHPDMSETQMFMSLPFAVWVGLAVGLYIMIRGDDDNRRRP